MDSTYYPHNVGNIRVTVILLHQTQGTEVGVQRVAHACSGNPTPGRQPIWVAHTKTVRRDASGGSGCSISARIDADAVADVFANAVQYNEEDEREWWSPGKQGL